MEQQTQENDDSEDKLSKAITPSRKRSRSKELETPTGAKILVGTESEVIRRARRECTGSHNRKTKHPRLFNSLNKNELEGAHPKIFAKWPIPTSTANKPIGQSVGGKGVLLGTWKDSNVPSHDKKHAVIGFIDKRNRLRMRIQPNTKYGDSLSKNYPLPSGHGRCWVTFDRVIFSNHLTGLEYLQIWEYTRIRSYAVPEETESERLVAEHAAVQNVIRHAKENIASTSIVHPRAVACGAVATIPEHPQGLVRSRLKQGEVIGGLAAIAPHKTRLSIDAPLGARPTHILIGYWKLSSEIYPENRNAVYGVIDQDDNFCVKVVRETRDRRFVGLTWIPYEEVEFQPHLKALNRGEIKEYCLFRQSQLDCGEIHEDTIENETKKVYETRIRAGGMIYP